MNAEHFPHAGLGAADDWQVEKAEWLESLDSLAAVHDAHRVRELLTELQQAALKYGVSFDGKSLNTPYRNSISVTREPAYPGDIELEQRIENIIRWNAMAMVLQGVDAGAGVGGHIATFASAATMMEVGYNHFFRNRSKDYGGDIVNVQPHAAPGTYARAFLEGRLTEAQLRNFRRELAVEGGLSSYPHPRRMPNLWPNPTASMGLSTAISVYQARFAKYLEHRGLKPDNGGKIWCFIGDGEADEPEVLGTIGIAARERLDNLVLVVNCNLQRLDGPVRGNGKIIQELERVFRGAGWHVGKVVWGSAWDELLARDRDGVLQRRMDEAVDGDYQLYSVMSGDKVREHWVRDDRQLRDLMKTLTDEEVRTIRRGGHDHRKLYAAFAEAVAVADRPSVVLVKTIKGYGMGKAGEGLNVAHQKKAMNDNERQECARRFAIPLSREAISRAEFYHPGEASAEVQYLRQRRQSLGGYQPCREVQCATLPPLPGDFFAAQSSASERPVSTTMSLVRMLSRMLRDEDIGRYVVPIVPDEARTFGMDGLFRQVGIYSSQGQQYQPVDLGTLTSYRESRQGQILQEGICETGAIASFLAAGTAFAHHGLPMVPFYFFYSMFGFQRVGDMIWACADALSKGFLIGGTAGRTTLNGEGLQHQDGHSQVVANTVPSLVSYDPAFAFEIDVILREGIRRMYVEQEDVFYYLTVYNEAYPMPAAPAGVDEGILRGMYRFRGSSLDKPASIHLLGSGSVMTEVMAAQEELERRGHATDVWSVTSYNELYRDATAIERHVRHAGVAKPRPWIQQVLGDARGVFIATTDYMKVLPESVGKWLPGPLVSLGTDGFGLSEDRAVLRDHFEVSAGHIVRAALAAAAEHRAGLA